MASDTRTTPVSSTRSSQVRFCLTFFLLPAWRRTPLAGPIGRSWRRSGLRVGRRRHRAAGAGEPTRCRLRPPGGRRWRVPASRTGSGRRRVRWHRPRSDGVPAGSRSVTAGGHGVRIGADAVSTLVRGPACGRRSARFAGPRAGCGRPLGVGLGGPWPDATNRWSVGGSSPPAGRRGRAGARAPRHPATALRRRRRNRSGRHPRPARPPRWPPPGRPTARGPRRGAARRAGAGSG